MQVPQGERLLCVLHITPVRASRALALRSLMHRVGCDMANVALLSLVPAADATRRTLSPYTGDAADLLAGAQQARAVGGLPCVPGMILLEEVSWLVVAVCWHVSA